MVSCTEVNMPTGVKWQVSGASPGSETMACRILRTYGNPGDPSFSCRASGEYAGQLITKGERQTERRKSDGIIVPMKAGNAAGGKDAT